MSVYSKDPKVNEQGKLQNEPSVSVLLIVATMVGFSFQDLVSTDEEISQVKQSDTFMNCYPDYSRQYVVSITQFSVGFPLKLYILSTIFDLVNWSL